MSSASQILTGALGGALLVYGLMQRAKSKGTSDSLESSKAGNEGWIGIVLGTLLLLSVLL
jgi:hypothetical protein